MKLSFTLSFVVTEEELTYGLLHVNSDVDNHCLCYMRDLQGLQDNLTDKKSRTYIDMKSSGQINSTAQKYLAFLKDVAIPKKLSSANIHRYTVDWLPNGISSHNQKHLDYLDAFGAQVHNDMQCLIDRARTKQLMSVSPYLLPVFEESLHHAHFCIGKCSMFQGRKSELNKIKNLLLTGLKHPFVIHGESGTGKTSLVAMVAYSIQEWCGSSAVSVFRFLGTSPCSSTIYATLLSVCTQLCILYGIKNPHLQDMEFTDITQFFNHLLLNDLPQKVKSHLFILLDSLDQLSTDNAAHALNWLPKTLPENVHIIVSTLSDKYDCLRSMQSVVTEEDFYLELKELPIKTGLEVFKGWLHKAGQRINESQTTAVSKVLQQCCQPLFIRLLFHQALTWSSYTHTDTITLPLSTPEALALIFSNLEEHHGEQLIQRSLGYLTASRHGLTEGELEDILSLDDDVINDAYQYWDPPVLDIIRIPQLLWKRVRYDISEFLVERQADGKTVLSWYHRQFIETARERYLSATTLVDRYLHANIATYFNGSYGGNSHKPITLTHRNLMLEHVSRHVAMQPLEYYEGVYNLRKLSELPFHLTFAGKIDDLKSLNLCNFKWLLTKLRATSYRETILDFIVALEETSDTNLTTVRDTLVLSAHSIKLDPTSLTGQLLGRLQAVSKNHQYIQSLLEQAQTWVNSYKNDLIYPVNDCLIGPGGPLKTTLSGHNGVIHDILFCKTFPTVVISTSKDSHKSLFNIWDISCIDAVHNQHTLQIVGDSTPCATIFNSWLVGACGDVIKVWNVQTGEIYLEISAVSIVTCLVSSQTSVIVGLQSGNLLLLHTDTKSTSVLNAYTKASVSTLSSSGELVVSGSSNGEIVCYSLQTCSIVWRTTDHKKPVTCLYTLYDDKSNVAYIASASEDIDLKIWHSHTGELLHSLSGHKKAIKCLAMWVSEDNLRQNNVMVASGSLDGTIRIWDLLEGSCIHILFGHSSSVWCIDVIPLRNVIVSGSKDDFLKVWDLNSGQCMHTLEGHSSWISAVKVHNKSFIISGSNDKSLKIWNPWDIHNLQTNERHLKQPECIAMTSCGSKTISGAPDSIKIWETSSGKCLCTFAIPASCIFIHEHKDNIAISGSNEGMLNILDLADFIVVHSFKGHDRRITSIATLQQSGCVLTASADGFIKEWTCDNWSCLNVYAGHTAGVECIAISSNCHILASGSIDCTIGMWHSPEERVFLQGHKKSVTCVSICSDKIASGSDDFTLRIWNIKTTTCMHVMHFTDSVKCLSLDSEVVIAGAHCAKEQLKSWNVRNGTYIHSYIGHTHAVMCMLTITCRNCEYLITGSRDGKVKLWKKSTAILLATFDLQSQVKHICAVSNDDICSVLSATTKSGPIAILKVLHPPNKN